jgi:predicted secreted hydrolase
MNARLVAFLTGFLPALAQAQGFGGLGAEAPGFAVPKRGAPIVFPADHAAHPAFRTEWWYVTANLHGADGKDYGVQWTLFRHALEAGAGAGWDDRTVFMAHAAATSAKTHVFAQTAARGGIGQAGVETAPFHAFIDDWSFTARDADFTQAEITAHDARFSYALTLTRNGPFVLEGDKGFSLKSEAGQASHYYSGPFFSVAGRLAIDGQETTVTGRAWMDREWSSQSLAPDQKGWDWLALHLASGEKLMLYNFRGGTDRRSGNWIAPDGATELLGNDDISMEPLETTAIGDRRVPTRWRIRVKSHGLDIETTPLNPMSWMGANVSYWEGPIAFSGSQAGEGYLEMTGY